MAFFTILVAPGLAPRDHRQAVRAGPLAVLTRSDHPTMLRNAGFDRIDETDVTPEFLTTLRLWSAEAELRADELKAVYGAEGFEDRQLDRAMTAAAVERGLLQRVLYVAQRS